MTGALGALGFTVPRLEDRMDWPESNPEHWESQSLSVFNEDLLRRLGGSWDGPPEMDDSRELAHDSPGATEARVLLATAFLGSGARVWKDPRVSLLLDYWRTVLDGPIASVLVWRSPLAMAHSLLRRDSIPLLEGLALWERYNHAAIEGLAGVDTYVVDYESIVADPQAFAGDVSDWLRSLEQFEGHTEHWDADRSAASIDKGLRHERADDPDEAEALVSDGQRQMVDRLTSMRGGHRPLSAAAPTTESVYTVGLLALRREMNRGRRELEAVKANLGARVVAAEGELAQARALAASTGEELESKQRSLTAVRDELAAVREDLVRSNEIITNMRASTSWRMTKPVRSVMSFRQGSAGASDHTG